MSIKFKNMGVNSNRLVLKIELFGQTKLKITLVYLDKRFLTTDTSLKYFYDDVRNKNEFHFFSKGGFALLSNSIKFPDAKFYERNLTAERNFDNEIDRYYYLRDLHIGLTKWNNNYTFFKNSPDHGTRRNNIKFQGEFWIL